MNGSILEMIVKATPTQKDDELLAMLKDFCDKYPFLKPMILDVVFNMILHKD